ncbi:MAG: hypothetical protein E4H09_02930 [Spirochaetales bacterium]|nr:MAG: hypothetical protein E4H09_02930 [Spirochaetales bacterium]
MAEDWTEVEPRGVVIDPMTGDPAVLLEDPRHTSIIAVPADPSTATAIISELEGIQRDPSHTLLYRFFIRHGVRVTRLELSVSRDREVVANIIYSFAGEVCVMDVRPVDGLIVAIQTNAPILAAGALIHSRISTASPRVLDGRDLLILSRTHDRR